ncbi:hypothetical protein [Armatimonas sp.]|uniref:hypothetical protein n=1 Tax=Armatimonas sp. TaxID=1872638 RepID=UPI00286AA61B|nr:hypothetical protein [Armatimonas sp.]
MTSLLWKFCHYGNAEARDEAYQEILERGETILPELIQAVEEELQRVRGSFAATNELGQAFYPGPEPLQRLVALLITYESPKILSPLAWVAAWRRWDKAFQQPFEQLSATLEARATPADIAAFIEALQRLRELSGTKAQQLSIANALLRMAEKDPKLELRAALPLLKPSLRTPWEFIELRQRLKAALGEENLPIPAGPPQPTRDLPIPMEKEESK